MFVLICGVMLFVPAHYLKYFGLDLWAVRYRPFFALGMLAFSFLFVFSLGEHFGRPLIARRKRIQQVERYLSTLSRDEALILSRYAESGTKTQYFHPANGAVNNLVQHHILYQSAGMYSRLKGLAYTLTPIAIPFVMNRPRFQKLLLAKDNPITRATNSN
jgi:hypothetical protein